MIWDALTTPPLSEGEVVIPHDLYQQAKDILLSGLFWIFEVTIMALGNSIPIHIPSD